MRGRAIAILSEPSLVHQDLLILFPPLDASACEAFLTRGSSSRGDLALPTGKKGGTRSPIIWNSLLESSHLICRCSFREFGQHADARTKGTEEGSRQTFVAAVAPFALALSFALQFIGAWLEILN